MTARCTNCSAQYVFKNTRGAKLSERRCSCGGKYEIMSLHVEPILMELSDIPEGCDHEENGLVYPRKNRSGLLFLFHRSSRKFIIINPKPSQP